MQSSPATHRRNSHRSSRPMATAWLSSHEGVGNTSRPDFPGSRAGRAREGGALSTLGRKESASERESILVGNPTPKHKKKSKEIAEGDLRDPQDREKSA